MERLSNFLSNRIIKKAILDEEGNKLIIQFYDLILIMWDNGQQCCENRYMDTDDDLSQLSGTTFVSIEIADCSLHANQDGDTEECQFLRIQTSDGMFVVKNYNIHNGYYSGFELEFSIGGKI